MKQNIFADNLKRFRAEKNYTQEQVAELLCVSAQSVSRWECGNTLPDVMLLPEIARVYGITVDDLFKEKAVAYKNYAQRLLAVYESTGKTEDFLRAEEEFQKLIASGECEANDIRSFGVLYHYMTKHSFEKAVHYLDLAIKTAKDSDKETFYRAASQKIALYSETGRSEESIAEQSSALEKDNDNPMQWCLLVAAYFFAERFDEAYSLSSKAVEKFPGSSSLHIYAGDICRALKKYDEAFLHWNKAFEIDGTYLDAKYSIGFCYEEIGDYANAHRIWKELAEELKRRGLIVESEFPANLAEKCADKIL
ncbi:MAG: helix-turn-helix domain-containing protein [Oscillospiraceae bacterium]|nr:helix-turn-helix domain-containing protein [Oscillospiraceae bacterium]